MSNVASLAIEAIRAFLGVWADGEDVALFVRRLHDQLSRLKLKKKDLDELEKLINEFLKRKRRKRKPTL